MNVPATPVETPVETPPVATTPPIETPPVPPVETPPAFELPAYTPPPISTPTYEGMEDWQREVAQAVAPGVTKQAVEAAKAYVVNQQVIDQLSTAKGINDETRNLAQQMLANAGDSASLPGAGQAILAHAMGAMELTGKPFRKPAPVVTAPGVSPIGIENQAPLPNQEQAMVTQSLGSGWKLDERGNLVQETV